MSSTPTSLAVRTGLAFGLALLLLSPVLALFGAVDAPTGEVWSHLGSEVLPRALANTTALLSLIAVLAGLPGVALAWLVVRYQWPARRLLEWALVLPLALPAYVVAFVYVGLLDFAGPVQTLWRDLGGAPRAFPELRSLPGAAAVLALVLYPYVYLIARAAFLRQGSAAFDAARALGCTPLAAFRRAVLPGLRPALAGALSLVLLEALADFGAVSILGVDTLSTSIYKTWFGLYSLPAAAQLALLLALAAAVVLTLEHLLRGRAGQASTTLPPPRKPLRPLRGWLVCAFAASAVVFGFLVPLAQLLYWILHAGQARPDVTVAAWHTLALAGIAAALVVMLALLMSWTLHRQRRGHWTSAIATWAGIGYAMPGTVLALGAMWMLLALERQSTWLAGLALSSSVVGVVWALVTRFFRVGHATVDAAVSGIRPSLLETARLHGAGRWRRWTQVLLPLLRPGVLAAFVLVLVETIKELPVTLMLRPFGWDTLAVKVYGYTSEGLWQQAAWPALWLVLVGLLPVWWLLRER